MRLKRNSEVKNPWTEEQCMSLCNYSSHLQRWYIKKYLGNYPIPLSSKDVVLFSSLCPIEQPGIPSYTMMVLNDNCSKLFNSHYKELSNEFAET